MACNECQDYEDSNGKCYTRWCSNFRENSKKNQNRPQSRSPIARQSKSYRKRHQTTTAMRHGPIDLGQVCDHEGCQRRASDPHEITAGPHKSAAMRNVRAMMWLCREHHTYYQSTPYAFQAAAVVRSTVNAINDCVRGKSGKVVSVEEVIEKLKERPEGN